MSALALFTFLVLAARADNGENQSWNALGVLRNARYVYVTSYDGPQFSTQLLPEDRSAISAVQQAIADDGYIVVYRPSEADMILVVQARGSSDLLAVYDAKGLGMETYLWRGEARNGLSGRNPVLVRRLEQALERAGRKG